MEKEIMECNVITYCKRCHRKLKDEKAKELGYGKICYHKVHKNNVPMLFEILKNNEEDKSNVMDKKKSPSTEYDKN